MEQDVHLSGHSNHGHLGRGGDYGGSLSVGSSRRFLGNGDNCVHVPIPFVRTGEYGAGLRALVTAEGSFLLVAKHTVPLRHCLSYRRCQTT